jgi:uncharacterized membrane protein
VHDRYCGAFNNYKTNAMKYIIGIFIALGIAVALTILAAVLNIEYQNIAFFIGWCSCTGFIYGKEYYEYKQLK